MTALAPAPGAAAPDERPLGATARPARAAAPAPALAGTTVDTWLGDGAALATLHFPASGGTTGVVICPPLGYEYTVAYRTLRHLADRLQANGFAAARFDHAGFGDSTAEPSLDLGARLAATELRVSGATGIVYLGLGSGALIAARRAAADPRATGLVLWDPAASGKAWLRRQTALYAIEVGESAEAAPDGSVEIAGAEFLRSFADSVAALDYDPALAERMPVLVAARESSTGPTLPRALRSAKDALTVLEVPGHEDTLDMSSILASIPAASVKIVVDWVARSFPIGEGAPRVPQPVTSVVTGDVVEELVRFGAAGLFGIESRPLRGESLRAEGIGYGDLPAVVLHNGSAEHRVGATRHQVELARRLAEQGVRVLRFDRQGTGESTPVRADEPSLLFTQEWLDDHEAALAHLNQSRDRVGVVGMCVGGWVGLVSQPASVKFVTALALNDHRVFPQAPVSSRPSATDLQDAPALKDRLVAWAKTHLPAPVLAAAARRGAIRYAEPNLRRALAAGTDVLVLLGPEDSDVWREHGGPSAVRRLRRTSGTLTVIERETGDHALYSPGIRQAALDASVEMAVRAFGLATAVTQPPAWTPPAPSRHRHPEAGTA